MQTKKIVVSNKGEGIREVLALVEKTSVDEGLERKKRMHLRLLTEETISLIKAITGEFDAVFWLEEEAGEYKLCLTARTEIDAGKKRGLLSVSSSGENTAARGIMGKIRDIIETGILNYDEIEKTNIENGLNYYNYGSMGINAADASSQSLFVWSLSRYRENLSEVKDEDGAEEWDELEKSIVANIADEVKVGVRNDKVELTVYKKL